MPYRNKVVLNCRPGPRPGLGDLVETFLRDGVKFVGVVGPDASFIEELIDQQVVGDGTNQERFILTSSHEGETLEEALEFARGLTGDYEGEVQVVDL